MKDTQLNSKTIWMVSHISAFLQESIGSSAQSLYVWYTDKGEIVLDEENNELKLVDCTLDDKTNYALLGLATSNGYTTGDYFTSND